MRTDTGGNLSKYMYIITSHQDPRDHRVWKGTDEVATLLDIGYLLYLTLDDV